MPADVAAHSGLTSSEVAERRAAGRVNAVPDRTSRSYGEIVRSNIFTRFNAIIAALAGVVLVIGHPLDALFAAVMVLNVIIGIVQEVRAKQTLDGLKVLVAPSFRVVRDGTETHVAAPELVADDCLLLAAGDQVPLDGKVLEASGLEVDESALTGEADPVPKSVDDEVLSGSTVVAGSATVVAVRVGDEAWIHKLVAEAKEFVLTRSELRAGVDRILQVVSWLVVPLAALLVWSQLRTDETVEDALVAAVAGVVALVPQGLVLLVSMAMAVAIIRLAREHVVVQELHAVEGLARVDVICLDKTGTLTTGKFALEAIEPLGREQDEVERGVAAMAAAEASPTSTMQLLAGTLGDAPQWTVDRSIAFSSARKWSGTSFGAEGTWIMGAPEILLDAIGASDGASDPRPRLEELTAAARRVMLVARTDAPLDGEELPDGLAPVGLVVLNEELRGDAAATMRYFGEQHVTVKVISGDNPVTVSALASELGVPHTDRTIDMRTIGDGDGDGGDAEFDRLVADGTVFGRVRPEQKRALVLALQRAGHTVAMTGDGVNDIPALKKADIGIAMDTATPATKAVSQLVLLDGRFDRMPNVVAEGRRVIANMERVSALFITKTVYAAIFAVVVGILAIEFPFIPRQLSLMDAITIGIPAFLLSFRASDRPSRTGYLSRVVRFAVPAGVAVAFTTLTTYGLVRSSLVDATLEEARTAAVIALTLTALFVLARLIWPVDRLEALLLSSLLGGFAIVLFVPWLADLFELERPPDKGLVVIAVVVGVSIVGFLVLLRVARAAGWANVDEADVPTDGAADGATTTATRQPDNSARSR